MKITSSKSQVGENFTYCKTIEKAKCKLCQATILKINSNVCYKGGYHSERLIHIQGSMNAAKAIKLIKEQLQLFCLKLNKDAVATVADGASLMLKFRKYTCPEHMTCYAHAINLAVCNVLYKKTQYKSRKNSIWLKADCKSDTKNDSIAEGEYDSEKGESNNAVPLEPNLQDVGQKV